MLVYVDPSVAEPLSKVALEGREIWQRENCQSCHQLYGFGGFLGPDLTNAHSHLSPERLHSVLTHGIGAMPELGLTSSEIEAVTGYLEAISATGQGQAKQPVDGRPPQHLAAFVAAVDELLTEDDDVHRRGFDLIQGNGCLGCHTPFTAGHGTPDLTTVHDRLTREQIHTVLADGKLPRMPASAVDPEDREVIYQFLGWLVARRDRLREKLSENRLRLGEVPWWNFR